MPTNFTTYAASPLSHLLSEVLNKIASIKHKYPAKNPKTASIDINNANTLLNDTETLLRILHTKILPKFSGGEVPSVINFITCIPEMLTLKSLKNKIYAQEKALIAQVSKRLPAIIDHAKGITDSSPLTESINTQLEAIKTELFQASSKTKATVQTAELDKILHIFKTQISALSLEEHRSTSTEDIQKYVIQHLTIELYTPKHPITYELMEAMTDLMKKAPDKFSNMISFFNPDIIVPRLLSSSLIAGDLKKEAGILKIEHIPDDTTGLLSYLFSLTKIDVNSIEMKALQTRKETRDFASEYVTERSRLWNMVAIPTTRRYLAIYADLHKEIYPNATLAIDNGLRKIRSEVARAEILQALAITESQTVLALTQKSDSFFKVSSTPTILELQALQQLHQDLIAELSLKRTHYDSITVDALLQQPNHAETLATFKTHEVNAYDLSYSTKPLPEINLCATEGIHALGGPIVPIRAALFSQIDDSLNALTKSSESIACQIKILKAQLKRTLSDKQYPANLILVNQPGLQQELEKTIQKLAALQEEQGRITIGFNALQIQMTQILSAEEIAQKELNFAEQKAQLHILQQNREEVISASMETAKEQTLNADNTEKHLFLLNLLPEIATILKKDLLTHDDKPKISFTAIELLINPIHPTSAHLGFFNLIKAIAPEKLENCKTYHAQQLDFFKTNPSREAFNTMISSLLESIDIKIKALPGQIEAFESQNKALTAKTLSLQKALTLIAEQCSPLDETSALLEKELSICALTVKETELKRHEHIQREQLAIISDIASLKVALDGVLEATVTIITPIKEANVQILHRINLVSIALKDLKETKPHQASLLAISQLLNPLSLEISALATTAKQQQDLELDALKIQHRQTLVSELMTQLNDYKKTRATKYKVKDFFSSNDQKKRHLFIDNLKEQLRNYNNSGNSEGTLRIIRHNIANFPGNCLKPLLNRIILALIEAQTPPTAIEKDSNASHQAAINTLGILEKTHAPYATTMSALYLKIDSMECYGSELTKNKDPYGEDVIQLAKQLKKEVDGFINDHGAKLPHEDNYNEFNEKFMARLHSKDNIMSKHHNKLGYIIGNILLLLLLIPKLIYSKISTGHYSFFFETTRKNKFINAIDKQACELAPIMVASPTV